MSSANGKSCIDTDDVVGAKLVRGEEAGDDGGDAPGVCCTKEEWLLVLEPDSVLEA